MSLSPDEFREHLELSAATAGLPLPDLDAARGASRAPAAACAFTISTGAPGPAARAVPARRRPQRPHVGPRVRRRCAASGTVWRSTSAATARASGRRRWTTRPRATSATSSAFVDALGLERFVLVGMSLGGANALAWAGRHSQRLAGLVMIDVGPEIRAEGVAARSPRSPRRPRRSTPSRSSWSARSASTRAATASCCAGACCTTCAACRTAASCGSTTSGTAAERSIPTAVRAPPRAPVVGGRRASRARRSSCAAPRATSSTTRTPSAWPAACAAGAGSRSRAPGHTVQGDNPAGLLVELREFLAEVAARR